MKRNTREHILEKGLGIVLEKGFNHTGLQELLRNADIPKGSFYHFFKSKEQFGLELSQFYHQQRLQSAQTILDDPSVPPLERLRRFFENDLDHHATRDFRGGCLTGNLSQEMADQCDKFSQELEHQWRQVEALLSKTLHEAKQDGSLKPAISIETTAAFLTNAWQGALIRMKLTKSSLPHRQFMTSVFDVILH